MKQKVKSLMFCFTHQSYKKHSVYNCSKTKLVLMIKDYPYSDIFFGITLAQIEILYTVLCNILDSFYNNNLSVGLYKF